MWIRDCCRCEKDKHNPLHQCWICTPGDWACEGKYEDLDFHTLLTLDPNTKFPKKVGSLYLNSLTTLDPRVKLPEKVIGSLYLNSLTTLDPGVKLPKEVGSLYLNLLTTLDPGVKLPKECGYLYLNSLDIKEKEELRKKYPHIITIR